MGMERVEREVRSQLPETERWVSLATRGGGMGRGG